MGCNLQVKLNASTLASGLGFQVRDDPRAGPTWAALAASPLGRRRDLGYSLVTAVTRKGRQCDEFFKFRVTGKLPTRMPGMPVFNLGRISESIKPLDRKHISGYL